MKTSLIIFGVILLVLGLFSFIIVDSKIRNTSKKDSYEKVVESKENIKIGDGKKREIVRERTEKHIVRDDDNGN
jgi:hypothetical protein